MNRESELKQTKRIVYNILKNYPMARDSDSYLYIRIVKELNPAAADKPFEEVILNLEELGLPCFETVRRTRQKLQAENPKLRASDFVQDCRTANEEVYSKFATS